MGRSDAEILWEVASLLARDAAEVSRPAGRISPPLPPLLFFTDPERTPRPWETAAYLPPGAGVVFRHFGLADARETALRLREATLRREGLLLIGLDADLAETVGADGVHLPERALGRTSGLRAAHPEWLITGAVHGSTALDAPGMNALVVSPVLPAGGASADRPALGLTTFRTWVEKASRPVYALGGIDAKSAPGLIGSGACGLAGVAAIQAAFGPA